MDELIPVSHLELDLAPPSSRGWHVYLAGRGIRVRPDDLGRPAIPRKAARRLFVERAESEARARELTARNDQMIELKRQTIPTGVPADLVGYAEIPGRAIMLATCRPRKIPARAAGLSWRMRWPAGASSSIRSGLSWTSSHGCSFVEAVGYRFR